MDIVKDMFDSLDREDSLSKIIDNIELKLFNDVKHENALSISGIDYLKNEPALILTDKRNLFISLNKYNIYSLNAISINRYIEVHTRIYLELYSNLRSKFYSVLQNIPSYKKTKQLNYNKEVVVNLNSDDIYSTFGNDRGKKATSYYRNVLIDIEDYVLPIRDILSNAGISEERIILKGDHIEINLKQYMLEDVIKLLDYIIKGIVNYTNLFELDVMKGYMNYLLENKDVYDKYFENNVYYKRIKESLNTNKIDKKMLSRLHEVFLYNILVELHREIKGTSYLYRGKRTAPVRIDTELYIDVIKIIKYLGKVTKNKYGFSTIQFNYTKYLKLERYEKEMLNEISIIKLKEEVYPDREELVEKELYRKLGYILNNKGG